MRIVESSSFLYYVAYTVFRGTRAWRLNPVVILDSLLTPCEGFCAQPYKLSKRRRSIRTLWHVAFKYNAIESCPVCVCQEVRKIESPEQLRWSTYVRYTNIHIDFHHFILSLAFRVQRSIKSPNSARCGQPELMLFILCTMVYIKSMVP